MFTGIIQDLGRVVSRESRGVDARVTIGTQRLDLAKVAIGDSICVQGVCLTVTSLTGNAFTADVSHETLSLTTLGELQTNSPVNLEPSLRAGDPLGGHLVSGHVDGVARVTALAKDGDSLRMTFDINTFRARQGSGFLLQ